MYFPAKIDQNQLAKLEECKRALRELNAINLASTDKDILISSQSSLYRKVPRDGTLYVIREGSLKCVRNDKVFYYAEEGDLVGFEGSAFDLEMDFSSEFAVVVSPIDVRSFLDSPETATAWNRFQGNFLSILFSGLSKDMKSESSLSPEVRSYIPGELIVEQGSMGEEVFSLIDGVADVLVGNQKVGEVYQDQLFGAVSVLTNTERIATVQARTECMVVVLSREQFISLVSSKPDTLLRLAEDLSKAIVSLNEQVRGLIQIPG
ncbi:MAG TPA: cyclic nucleotide-binding domain-containing protein [Oligoflexia bacterium]|nr:cyclic nucleotide-binding domain-containing protein [Oligoflexia bacterium]HMP47835.1 cyclic nucleotide-binding domain-containing protein [Oligoflexia bacterium]